MRPGISKFTAISESLNVNYAEILTAWCHHFLGRTKLQMNGWCVGQGLDYGGQID